MAPAGPAIPPALEARIESLPRLLADPAWYDEAFTPAFRDAVSPAQWRALIEQLAQDAGAPLETANVRAVPPWSADVEVRFERALVGLRITLEPTPPFRLAGLLLTGAAPVQAPESTLPAVLDAIRSLHGGAALAIARLGAEAPVTLHRVAGDRAMSVGSEFKLVILAETIRAVAAGERGWDDLVALDGRRQLPGGRYTGMPTGTTVPLRDVVTAMISVSDNSAADVMAALLGRDRLEAMLPQVGISRPEGMRPFLTALELFKLKAMIAAGQTDWLQADEARRRELLAGPVAAMPLDAVDKAFAPGLPLSIETVEWRASPEDIVRVLDWIRRHTETGPAAEARAILAANPLIGPRAAAEWGYVGFKGGSEPGVVASLLLQRRSGEWLAVSAAWNDPANRVNDERFVSLIVRLAALLRMSE